MKARKRRLSLGLHFLIPGIGAIATTRSAAMPASEQIVPGKDVRIVFDREVTPLDERRLWRSFRRQLRRTLRVHFLEAGVVSSGKVRNDEHAGENTDFKSARESAAFSKNSFGDISNAPFM